MVACLRRETLTPVEWNRSGRNVVAILSNDSGEALSGPFSVYMACFSAAGDFTAVPQDFADNDCAGPGTSVSSQIRVAAQFSTLSATRRFFGSLRRFAVGVSETTVRHKPPSPASVVHGRARLSPQEKRRGQSRYWITEAVCER